MKWTNIIAAAAFAGCAFAADESMEAVRRMDEAAKVFQEINAAPDKGIPQDILEKAHCVGIVPGLKRAGFIVGGKYGKGVLLCRSTGGKGWTGPSTIRVEGGSVGLQIGAGETDLVFAVMNQRGMEKLLDSKFTVGGDAAAMAGPVGRTAQAQTDALMRAEILSWSRARGAFAGVSLTGATMRPDDEDNHKIYGKAVTHRDILTGKVRPPASAASLYTALGKYMPPAKAAKR
jgi:lipid-binding SYLF domain-containing protein